MRLLTLRANPSARSAARARRPLRWSRRSIIAAAAGGFALVAAGTGWWLVRSGIVAEAMSAAGRGVLAWTASWGLAVGDVQVEGRERASREAILIALGATRGMPILAVDPVQAKLRLETIPWVRTASVERRLPDAIYVRLVERQPLAFWQRDGKLVPIDRDGVSVPNDHPGDFGGLLVLVGADAPKAGAALLAMIASEPELAPHVAAAVRVGGRRWNLRLDSGIDVALPEDDPAAAWHRLAQLERSDGILERDILMVDLRLPDRLTVHTPATEAAKTPLKKGRQPGKTS